MFQEVCLPLRSFWIAVFLLSRKAYSIFIGVTYLVMEDAVSGAAGIVVKR